jgi:uncharacterized protein (TIGR02145 family)
MHPTMNRFLASFLLVLATVLGHAQGTMNIYQTNGSILQVALSSIDSVTYQLAPPPPLMRIHQTGGSILSLAVAQIDSITYSTGGAPGTAQVATLPATGVGSNSAICAGTITAAGGSSVTARGICYGTVPLPDLGGPFISVGAGIGTFQGQITGLQPNTLYYAQAYATNGQGTAYGNAVAFVTTGNTGGALPSLVSAQPTGVNSHSASAGGQVTDDGGNSVVARGVVWGTGPNPTLANNFTVDGAGLGTFTSALSDLPASTAFFVRAYATNSAGTAYGGAYQISTSATTVAAVTTDEVNGVTATSATVTGTVVHQGGVAVTDRGFCWSNSPNPTLQNNQGFVTAGGGLGGFLANLSGLAGNTTYYVRAYATNSAGTQYGSQLQFTTSPVPPTVSTAVVSNIGALAATCGGNVSATGGLAVTQYGVCWSTSPNPTTADNTTSDGSGTGGFSSSLQGLEPSTAYYVRAYAVNGVGTAYGNEVQFTTTNGIPVLTTSAVSFLQASNASSGGSISSDGGAAITVRGVCWSTSPNPTTVNNSTNNGSGLGSYTSILTGLVAGTTYYVRAYATNTFTTAYGNELQYTGIVSNPGIGVTFDGYNYASVILGNGQEWLAENLRTTTYANGDPIPNVTSTAEWTQLTNGAWVHYQNNSSYENPYGKLYNWYAVADPRNVCPTDWHVPTDAEWNTLVGYLDPAYDPVSSGISSATAGGMMKSTGTQYWLSPNTGATNESGFSGLPGGDRKSTTGSFAGLGYDTFWWSASESDADRAWFRQLQYSVAMVFGGDFPKRNGFSVRCIRD